MLRYVSLLLILLQILRVHQLPLEGNNVWLEDNLSATDEEGKVSTAPCNEHRPYYDLYKIPYVAKDPSYTAPASNVVILTMLLNFMNPAAGNITVIEEIPADIPNEEAPCPTNTSPSPKLDESDLLNNITYLLNMTKMLLEKNKNDAKVTTIQNSLCNETMGRKLIELGPCLQEYVICYHGSIYAVSCPEGTVFSQLSQTCIYSILCSLQSVETAVNSTSDGEEMETIIADSQYFLNCTNDTAEVELRDSGLKFDKDLLEGIKELLNHSTHNPCQFKLDGSYSFQQCSQLYLSCSGANFTWHHCAVGLFYSERWKICLPECDSGTDVCPDEADGSVDFDERVVCINGTIHPNTNPKNTTAVTDKRFARAIQSINNPCTTFGNSDMKLLTTYSPAQLMCIYGQPYWQLCPENEIFDFKTSSCQQSGLTEPGELICSFEEEEAKALDSCSATYVQCLRGKAYSLTCPEGMVFYNVTKSCVKKEQNPYCEQNPCHQQKNGPYALDDCSGTYIVCMDGQAHSQVCADGMVFLNLTNSCVSKNENPYCESEIIGPCTPGRTELKALDACSGTFILCLNGKALNQVCPDGEVFHNEEKICVPKAESPFCRHPLCPPKGRIRKALQLCSSTYLECVDGIGKNATCPDGNAFYEPMGFCISEWSHPQCAEAAISSCAVDGVTWADPEDRTVFYKCINGVKVMKRCPQGTIFNEVLHVCEEYFIVQEKPLLIANGYGL